MGRPKNSILTKVSIIVTIVAGLLLIFVSLKMPCESYIDARRHVIYEGFSFCVLIRDTRIGIGFQVLALLWIIISLVVFKPVRDFFK